ncbi:response regulator [Flavobacterium sp. Sd200]|uniref:response regulator n=1 Tax=Flavobacterium sp. Sd200 TaxID=2692211 RepID=UPI00136FDE7E|nr:response regulator [Flavobacterium sp. Sd200]MXN90657.1 response regulator [Flavobacterium sp. Sd200]
MKTTGDIVVIEDDPDDYEILLGIFEEVMKEKNYDNRVIVFEDSVMALEYLQDCTSEVFMIISDINMPLLDGLELYQTVSANPKFMHKGIPYVFLTTGAAHKEHVYKARDLSVHGFFEKPSSLREYKSLISDIMGYWQKTLVPFA